MADNESTNGPQEESPAAVSGSSQHAIDPKAAQAVAPASSPSELYRALTWRSPLGVWVAFHLVVFTSYAYWSPDSALDLANRLFLLLGVLAVDGIACNVYLRIHRLDAPKGSSEGKSTTAEPRRTEGAVVAVLLALSVLVTIDIVLRLLSQHADLAWPDGVMSLAALIGALIIAGIVGWAYIRLYRDE